MTEILAYDKGEEILFVFMAEEEDVWGLVSRFPTTIYFFAEVLIGPNEAEELVKYALNLRMYGEDPVTGSWRDWDSKTETYLRSK